MGWNGLDWGGRCSFWHIAQFVGSNNLCAASGRVKDLLNAVQDRCVLISRWVGAIGRCLLLGKEQASILALADQFISSFYRLRTTAPFIFDSTAIIDFTIIILHSPPFTLSCLT